MTWAVFLLHPMNRSPDSAIQFMVIFPIAEEQKSSADPVPIWTAVQEREKQIASDYWVITQPAHGALAGELAAALRDDLFGPIDPIVSRSIALHDAGWSMDDAEQIQRLRSDPKLKPRSFLDAAVGEYVQAWTGSIDTAERFAPIGGYLVSRHFQRLSQRDDHENRARLEAFREHEKQRQKKLREKIGQDEAVLERLVDALQLCDVLSLYLCCGTTRSVVFESPKLTIMRVGEEYRLDPSPFKDQKQFSFSALRHPTPDRKKGKAGGTFYINL